MVLDLENDPVWYPYTPIPHQGPREKLVRADGPYVFTEQGHRVFDATSSWWCQIHGHSHPRLVQALQKQAETLDHVMMAPHAHEPAQRLAEDILQVLGKPYGKVFFSDNGSTAVEVALKMLIQYWRMRGENRLRFLTLKNAYHGDTLGTIALSGTDYFHRHFKEDGEAYQADLSSLASAETILKANPRLFAGAIVEPLVLGAGGMVFYPKEYLEGFTRLCREYSVPVIFDEVFTGFGRTGKMFAFEHIESRPDFVCLSKGLTSGMMPLGLTITTSMLFKEFVGGVDRTFFHGHTFTGNPLACAVAIESLAIFRDERVIEKIQVLIEYLADQEDRFTCLPIVKEVRQLGMIWVVELKTESNKLGWEVCENLWQRGYWLRPLHQMLYLIPPYCSAVADLSGCVDALEAELKVLPTKRI